MHELYVSLDRYKAPLEHHEDTEVRLVNFELGSSKIPSNTERDYWDLVKQALQKPCSNCDCQLTKLVLSGENATNSVFLNVLRDALNINLRSPRLEPSTEDVIHVPARETAEDDISKIKLEEHLNRMADPTFAAARGAALYARIRQVAPVLCMEKTECSSRRDQERDHTIAENMELK